MSPWALRCPNMTCRGYIFGRLNVDILHQLSPHKDRFIDDWIFPVRHCVFYRDDKYINVNKKP